MVFKAFVLLAGLLSSSFATEGESFDVKMPNVRPYQDELYLCTQFRLAPMKTINLVGFKPNASMLTAHHMILYGCTEPGANDEVWECGKMQYNTTRPCKSTSQIVYSWGLNATSLFLPKGVGFLVGKDTPIKYLVLQVHYTHKFDEGKVDSSGITVVFTKDSLPRQAGLYLLGTDGMLSPHHVEHMETACIIQENKVLHPFAFRTHTHSLGKVVSGYVVRNTTDGQIEWQLIGKNDPLLPQMFYPVVNNTPIRSGDILAARCTMDNNLDHIVEIGPTKKDEMCNFYIMYYVENDTPLQQIYCFSPGAPAYHWKDNPELVNIPDVEASLL